MHCITYGNSYGAQDGDGEAGISPDEQIQYTAERIAEFVRGK